MDQKQTFYHLLQAMLRQTCCNVHKPLLIVTKKHLSTQANSVIFIKQLQFFPLLVMFCSRTSTERMSSSLDLVFKLLNNDVD